MYSMISVNVIDVLVVINVDRIYFVFLLRSILFLRSIDP